MAKILPTVDSDDPGELMKSLFENASRRLGPDEARGVLLESAGSMAAHQTRMAQFAKDHDVAGAFAFLSGRKYGVIGLTEEHVAESLAKIRQRHGWA